jgi:hypothetical protein
MMIEKDIAICAKITLPKPLPSREGIMKPSPLAGEGRVRGAFTEDASQKNKSTGHVNGSP